MPYMLESHERLESDKRLQDGSPLVRKLAQDIARVLKEIGTKFDCPDPLKQLVRDLLANDGKAKANRESLIALVKEIGAQVPSCIVTDRKILASDLQLDQARDLCRKAALAIKNRILTDRDALARVFGDRQVVTARNVLTDAAISLECLATAKEGWTLIHDNTLRNSDMVAAGSRKTIKFSDLLFDESRAPLTMLLHEATHTLDPALMTRDYIYRDKSGFCGAPAWMKLLNAAHYEEVGWQVLQNTTPRTLIPSDDIKAIVSMTVTTAWVMSTWITQRLKSTERGNDQPLSTTKDRSDSEREVYRSKTNHNYRQNTSRLLGLTLHDKSNRLTREFNDRFNYGIDDIRLSVVDEIRGTHRSMALSRCMGALDGNALDGFDAQGMTAQKVFDAALLRVIGQVGPAGGLRASNEKSLDMIKALSALYLIEAGHLRQDKSDPGYKSPEDLLFELEGKLMRDDVMSRYVRLLEGHIERISKDRTVPSRPG